MSPEQHFHVMQLFEVFVVDGDKSLAVQTLHLHPVVHNVAQAIKCLACGQFFFSFLDGSGHAKAETTATVYLYLYHYCLSFDSTAPTH